MASLTGLGIYADGAILTFGIQFLGFAVAATLQTEVFYDILGGVNFLAMAFLCKAAFEDANNAIFVVLFIVSRGWLLGFLAWRAHDRKGDARFDGIRDVPSAFFVYWAFQAVWVYCISLPLLVMVAGAAPSSDEDSDVDTNQKLEYASYGMLAGMALSILAEILSDVAKAKWVANGRFGGFCTDGLWKHSRHPNYAGEILTWVFAAIYAVLVAGDPRWASGIVAAISPLFTMQILLNTSGTGVWNAEGKTLKRYYEHPDQEIVTNYKEYRRTTPPVFPAFCLPYERFPLIIQRTIFFEWERYEYRPSLSSSKGSITSEHSV